MEPVVQTVLKEHTRLGMVTGFLCVSTVLAMRRLRALEVSPNPHAVSKRNDLVLQYHFRDILLVKVTVTVTTIIIGGL